MGKLESRPSLATTFVGVVGRVVRVVCVWSGVGVLNRPKWDRVGTAWLDLAADAGEWRIIVDGVPGALDLLGLGANLDCLEESGGDMYNVFRLVFQFPRLEQMVKTATMTTTMR